MNHLGAGPATRAGERGTEMDHCPAWYLRTPRQYPGRSYGVHGTPLFFHVAEVKHWLEHGALGRPDRIPGRLSDCIRLMAVEEARIYEMQERARKHDDFVRRNKGQAP